MRPGNDRYWAQIGALGVMCVPHDRIECFPGINGKDDERYKTYADLSKAMVDDGFPEWKIYQEKEEWPHYGSYQSLAVEWSHLRVLRQIVDRGENAIILEDDRFLTKNFVEIEDTVNRMPGIKALLLWWTFLHGDDPHYHIDEMYKQRMRSTDVQGVFTGYVPCGHSANFYTAEGAHEVLSYWRSKPDHSGESLLWKHNLENPYIKGYYHCMPAWGIELNNRLETRTYK